MSGQTLVGEGSCFLPDGSLLNCDSEDMNEPFDDSFVVRAEVAACGRWVDMNQQVVGDVGAWRDSEGALLEADVPIDVFYRYMGAFDFLPVSQLGLEDPVGEPLDTDADPGEDRPDNTGSKISADDPEDLIQDEFRSRLPISRRVRYKRSALRNA